MILLARLSAKIPLLSAAMIARMPTPSITIAIRSRSAEALLCTKPPRVTPIGKGPSSLKRRHPPADTNSVWRRTPTAINAEGLELAGEVHALTSTLRASNSRPRPAPRVPRELPASGEEGARTVFKKIKPKTLQISRQFATMIGRA